jgi:CopG family nickel-responsive transcriptional regulator
MQRFTITIDEDLLGKIDAVVESRGYSSRSEAVRDMIRVAAQDASLTDETPCVAVLGYVYDHGTRALAQRLIRAAHDHHDLSVAGMHMHLDHESCLEVSVLRGSASAVRMLSDVLTAQRGVRHANLHLIPVGLSEAKHRHGGRTVVHTHVHA